MYMYIDVLIIESISDEIGDEEGNSDFFFLNHFGKLQFAGKCPISLPVAFSYPFSVYRIYSFIPFLLLLLFLCAV